MGEIKIGDEVRFDGTQRGTIVRVQGRGVALVKMEGSDKEVWRDLKDLVLASEPPPPRRKRTSSKPASPTSSH